MINYLVLHHFVNPNNATISQQRALVRWVKWQPEIYHYAVLTNGEVVWIHHDEKFIGHCGIDNRPNNKPCNRNSIGIVCMGNFMKTAPKSKQLNGLVKLCARLMVKHFSRLDTIESVIGHKEVAIGLPWSTQCPGDEFPIERIKDEIMKQLKPEYIEFKADTNEVEIDGKRHFLDHETENINGVTFLPARSFMELLNYQVGWNSENETIMNKLKEVK